MTRMCAVCVVASVALAGCATGGDQEIDGFTDTPLDHVDWVADTPAETPYDAFRDPDVDPAPDPTSDPDAEPPDEPEEDPDTDTGSDPASDPGTDPAPDPSTDAVTDSTGGIVWCVPYPPTDCTIYATGCCPPSRTTVECYRGMDMGRVCRSGYLCGPDPSTGEMTCIASP